MARASATGARGGPDAPRVLLAEASPPLRWWLTTALARLSPRLTQAEDGVDLLYRLAEHGPYDLVVAAADLPLFGAAQVLAMARAAGDATPFLLLAPLADGRLRALLARTGPAALIDDPLDGTALVDAARGLLRERDDAAAPPRWDLSLPMLARPWRR